MAFSVIYDTTNPLLSMKYWAWAVASVAVLMVVAFMGLSGAAIAASPRVLPADGSNPTNASATAITANEVVVNWTSPSFYIGSIVYQYAGVGCVGAATDTIDVSPLLTAYPIGGLAAHTAYSYKVVDVVSWGSSGGARVVSTPTACVSIDTPHVTTNVAPSDFSFTSNGSADLTNGSSFYFNMTWTEAVFADASAVTGYFVLTIPAAACPIYAYGLAYTFVGTNTSLNTTTTIGNVNETSCPTYFYDVLADNATGGVAGTFVSAPVWAGGGGGGATTSSDTLYLEIAVGVLAVAAVAFGAMWAHGRKPPRKK